jgi:hypothetical protein
LNIAELFVRIRGDTGDLIPKLRAGGKALDDFGASAGRAGRAHEAHGLSLRRVESVLATYVGHAVGANRVTEVLSTTIGSFALGGGPVAAALLGFGAIVGVYEKMTEGARKATEEGSKLIKSLNDQAKAAYDASVQGQQLIQLQAEVELQRAKSASVVGPRSFLQSLLTGKPAIAAADAEAASNRIADAQTAVEQATKNVGKAWQDANKPLNTAVTHVRDLNAEMVKYNELIARMYGNIGLVGHDFSGGTLASQIARSQQNAIPSIADVFGGALKTPTGPVDISDSVKIANDQAKAINEAAEKHSQMIRDAIWGSAAALANSVVSALNFGGGGRGSNVGGGIGSTLGFAAGSFLPFPGGGAIGSIIGNITGSLIGGLFDHNTKAVNANTAATDRNTAALLLNAPSGYKIASARYDATDVRALDLAKRRWTARGGPAI